MSFSATVLLLFVAAFVTIGAFSIEPRQSPYGEEMVARMEMPARRAEYEFMKRFLPAKERRAPLDGFEDMSGFLRTIDGIQKPRFG